VVLSLSSMPPYSDLQVGEACPTPSQIKWVWLLFDDGAAAVWKFGCP